MKFQKLYEEAKQLRKDVEIYKKEIKNSRCDKHNLGFNIDSRFSACKVTVSLDSYTGYFGDSGCGRAIHGGENLGNYLVKYLNAHKYEILQWIWEAMERDALKHIDEAIEAKEKELAELKALKKGSR